MILSDVDIRQAIKDKHIIISPEVKDEDIQPCTIDLHLGRNIIHYNYIDYSNGYLQDLTEAQLAGCYFIRPHEFILAEIAENITIDNTLCANIEGKSSLGRKGLFVHVSAGFIDPGWSGILTLEVYNASNQPQLIEVGQKFCQIKFSKLITPSERAYGHKDLKSHYQFSSKVETSRQ